MPTTQTRALRLVDGIYRFVGGAPESFRDFDETPTPVIDMSRISEIGAGYLERDAGFFIGGNVLTNATMAAANIRASFDPFDGVDFARKDRNASWVWLLGYSVSTTDQANHTESGAAARLTDSSNREIIIYDIRGVSGNAIVSGSTAQVLNDQGEPGWTAQMPLFLELGTEIRQWTSSADDCVTTHSFLLWAGPTGARPPGVA